MLYINLTVTCYTIKQKDRSGMDLTEGKYIKRWQEYTKQLYKKELHDQ